MYIYINMHVYILYIYMYMYIYMYINMSGRSLLDHTFLRGSKKFDIREVERTHSKELNTKSRLV